MLRPKSPELIQAQLEAFATSSWSNEASPKDRVDLLQTASRLSRIRRNEVVPSNLTGLQTTVTDDFTTYLRHQNSFSRETISAYEDGIKRYTTEFKGVVSKLKNAQGKEDLGFPYKLLADVTNTDNPEERCQVYRVDLADKTYVIKFHESVRKHVRNIDAQDLGTVVEAMIRMRNKEHFNRYVAHSIEDLALVTELAPGRELKELLEEGFQLKLKHIDRLLLDMREAFYAGVALDIGSAGQNIFYDGNEFTHIDYHLLPEDRTDFDGDWVYRVSLLKDLVKFSFDISSASATEIILESLRRTGIGSHDDLDEVRDYCMNY